MALFESNLLNKDYFSTLVPTTSNKNGKTKFKVTSADENANNGLRHALNQSPTQSSIQVNFDRSIQQIKLNGPIRINQQRKVLLHADKLSLVQTGLGSIFEVEAGSELYLIGFSLEGAKSQSALVNDGKLLLKSCVVQYNERGAILNKNSLEVESCLFYKNYSPIGGGAIRLPDENTQAIVKDSSFSRNKSRDVAGAIYSKGNLLVEGSAFSDNTASVQAPKHQHLYYDATKTRIVKSHF